MDILVDLAAGVHEGQVVLVHQVLQHEIYQAWEVEVVVMGVVNMRNSKMRRIIVPRR